MKIEKNMGTIDRIVRPSIAIGIVAAYATGKLKGKTAIGLLTLSAIFIATSTVGWCPVYSAAGINTIENDKDFN